jgi:hypothetical protein
MNKSSKLILNNLAFFVLETDLLTENSKELICLTYPGVITHSGNF